MHVQAAARVALKKNGILDIAQHLSFAFFSIAMITCIFDNLFGLFSYNVLN